MLRKIDNFASIALGEGDEEEDDVFADPDDGMLNDVSTAVLPLPIGDNNFAAMPFLCAFPTADDPIVVATGMLIHVRP